MTEKHKQQPLGALPDVSRREFLKGASLTIAAVGLTGANATTVAATQDAGAAGARVVGPDKVPIQFTLNGQAMAVSAEPHVTLLDLVRDEIGLTGAKRVCDRGACGACTMLIDGRTANSCSVLAIDVAGKSVTSIEGLTPGDELSALQEAFVECDALQCGFCTPGMVVACSSVLSRTPNPTRAQIAEGIAGNICRCGTYQNIFEAVELAARKGAGGARK
ncbi:MAG: (2Fe-2S)-binding protein [Planctomycetota bacterium]